MGLTQDCTGNDLTYRIIGEAMTLHNQLGHGYKDEVYEKELKAFSHPITNDEIAQMINYLKATGAQVGLILNFGRRALEYKRIFPPAGLTTDLTRVGRENARKSTLPEV